MQKIIVSNEDQKKRLDVFVQEKFSEISRSRIKNLIEDGLITVDQKKVKSGYSLKEGQTLEITIPEDKPLDAQAEDIDFEIVYEDSDLIVVNKPQGLVVHPCASTKTGTLVNGLIAKIKDLSGINGVLRPGIVHRLDKFTSGLMLVAKNDFSHISLAKQIKDKTCKRNYLAVLEGNLKEDQGRVETFIDRSKKDRKKMSVSDSGKLAITDYIVKERFKSNCLVEFSLKTGRTHQIRVHASYLHHPVVGDEVYGRAVKGLAGQLLHSYKISFVHPRTNKEMTFEIDLPDYFKAYLQRIK